MTLRMQIVLFQLQTETFAQYSILSKVKKDEGLALTVARKRLRRGTACNRRNTFEYFEDSADASLRAKAESDVEIGQERMFCKGLRF
ncbi:MAG: hypothetical protein JRE24_11315 [Deltaproteobacteria bacterium]|nr:hypothetical protein [Deltaproteobacteria bacterium]